MNDFLLADSLVMWISLLGKFFTDCKRKVIVRDLVGPSVWETVRGQGT